MADQTFDSRLGSLLRSALTDEVASLPVSVTADQVLERARMREGGSVVGRLRRLGQPTTGRRRLSFAAAAGSAVVVIVLAGVIGLTYFLNQKPVIGPSATNPPTASAAPTTMPSPSVDPTSAASPAEPVPTPVQPSSGDVPLDWSSDGTRLLVQRDLENLFVLNAEGSETQVTDQLSGFSNIPGSARPSGATISPDGSRVVFAGLTKPWQDGNSCHNGGLFAVDADGGPAELLWESQVAQNGIVRYPTFSPDGTQIAFADGYCDSSHGVWVMNADGTNAHQIVPTDFGPFGATHVHGLSWSAAGDRIAILVDQGFYGFAPDGSGFTQITDSSDFCWPWNPC